MTTDFALIQSWILWVILVSVHMYVLCLLIIVAYVMHLSAGVCLCACFCRLPFDLYVFWNAIVICDPNNTSHDRSMIVYCQLQFFLKAPHIKGTNPHKNQTA